MIVSPGTYQGKIVVPASKSDSQRALLAAGLANGESLLLGVGKSDDELAMRDNIIAFGAELSEHEQGLHVVGTPFFPSETHFDLRESGLGARLLCSLCIVKHGRYELSGSGSLVNRPFSFFKENFEGMVKSIVDNNGFLPLNIEGGFAGGELTVSGKESSQYISGLLMALPLASGDSRLYVEELNSKPYVQMTLNTLAQFGIRVENHALREFIVPGNQRYLPTSYTVEGDWSSASYWLVASALGQKISVAGLSLRTLQADVAILKAFSAANCHVQNRYGYIFIDGTARTAFEFDATHAPDLFPALASLAAFTEGQSTIFGLHRLAHKESNRGETIKSEFEKIGVTIELNYSLDCLVVSGVKTILGGRVFSNHDHRIAMCLAILGMFSKYPIEIEHPEAVKKSYPGFWEDLEGLEFSLGAK